MGRVASGAQITLRRASPTARCELLIPMYHHILAYGAWTHKIWRETEAGLDYLGIILYCHAKPKAICQTRRTKTSKSTWHA
jgi:hypothetical protein